MSIWTDAEGIVHVAVMVKGRRVHRRLPKDASKGDAKQLEAEIRKSIGTRNIQIPGDPLLTDILDLYLDHLNTLRSPDTARYHALRCVPWCEGKRASNAQTAAQKMIADMREHYAPATINRSLGAMKKALTIAYRSGVTHADYGDKIKRLPENNRRHIYLSVAQVKKIADRASETTRAAIWIALLTGCRRGEILKITKDDIGEDSIRIRQGNTKTLQERICPIVPALRPWLEYIPLQITYEGIKSGFRRAREMAGMPEVHFHDLRHSCASILINAGVPLEVIRDVLGHTSVKTTERYAHLQIDRQKDAMNKLSKMVSAKKITPEIAPEKKNKKAARLKAA